MTGSFFPSLFCNYKKTPTNNNFFHFQTVSKRNEKLKNYKTNSHDTYGDEGDEFGYDDDVDGDFDTEVIADDQASGGRGGSTTAGTTEDGTAVTSSSKQATDTKRVPDKDRKTTKYMTKFEKARVLGTRALQISMNAPVMVELKGETDPLEIARKELIARKIPMIIRRYLPDKSYEDWNVNELLLAD